MCPLAILLYKKSKILSVHSSAIFIFVCLKGRWVSVNPKPAEENIFLKKQQQKKVKTNTPLPSPKTRSIFGWIKCKEDVFLGEKMLKWLTELEIPAYQKPLYRVAVVMASALSWSGHRRMYGKTVGAAVPSLF